MRSRKVSPYDEEESRILQKSSHMIDFLANKGLIEDPQITDEKIRKAQKETAKKSYHNTEVLLEQYNTIVWILECAPSEIAQELKVKTEKIDELIEKIDCELATDNKKLEGKIRTIIKTRRLIERVNDALMVLKMKPRNGEIMYRIIYEAFLDEESRTWEELVERMHMSRSTYYRLRVEALKTISTRLWGSADPELDDWLEILMLLEEL